MSLSNFSGRTFTIINQIPQSKEVSTKVAWDRHTLLNCGKRSGIYDKSSGTIAVKSNTWTVYVHNWQNYRAPNWQGGYYSLNNEERKQRFTANVGDLVIFADISYPAPSSAAEFTALVQKYRDLGGLISGTEVYINYKSDGTPWKTNHIELIKG